MAPEGEDHVKVQVSLGCKRNIMRLEGQLRKDYFHMVVQIAVRPMRHLLPEHGVDRPRIGIMPIGRDVVRR
jgi:hypothetical protein